MSAAELEFHFDPVCPFCWVTSRWVCEVARQRPLQVTWRPLALRILNEPIGYENRPAEYPDAHQRGLEMLRVVDAARETYGSAPLGELYTAMGQAVWDRPAPQETTFEAVLSETARGRDLAPILSRVGMSEQLAEAADDTGRDATLRAETRQAVERAGGGVGTPILSFAPPDGPAFFGPVIDTSPEGDEALRLWDAVTTLAHWPAFAKLKRGLRSFPRTPLSSHLAGESTRVR
ncbi:mycothiol-dependent nitroreductase Rv2466c family protein [Haloactinomyces albus]|uniref:2-hydroxychromene-2-carboxylate isomerase n=1 Tax=Haloactinomyces albus TaxID=1352928 RepID=A0AAE4CK85_9ACTN|nr:DsbA family protein [Haloactinomyces albus]MDR7300071.1 2-hydroxychromene-2-carboxylate isomerase [Haloactinomyces albus]